MPYLTMVRNPNSVETLRKRPKETSSDGDCIRILIDKLFIEGDLVMSPNDIQADIELALSIR